MSRLHACPTQTFAITPASAPVRAGIVAGEIADLRVKNGDVARLLGTLSLRNTAERHSVRLVSGTIRFLDARWSPIRFHDGRTGASFIFSASGTERLDPGHEAQQGVEVPCPAEALEAGALKGVRLEIAYVSSPIREEIVSFAVSIARQPE
jgi:hypothetical protein